MIHWFSEWWNYIAVALISSILNLFIAYEKLDRDCRSPFFNPWKIPGVWLWGLVQLSLPATCFWLLYSLSAKPPVNHDLITKAITFGLVFVAFAHSEIDTGFFGLPLDKWYFFLTELVYKQIAASQTLKIAEFRTDLRDDLNQGNKDLAKGLRHLEDYILSDVALRLKGKESEKQKLLARVNQTRSQTVKADQVGEIVELTIDSIRPRDVPATLRRFECNNGFLKKYFPK